MSLSYELYKEGGLLNNRYQKVEDISEGSYGYVSLANDIKEKSLVAVKYIFKLDTDDDDNDSNDSDSHVNDSSARDSSFEKHDQMVKRRNSVISEKVKSRLSNDICLEALYEVEIQLKIGRHKNIVSLLDFFDSYIILEYCSGGDLYEAIKDDIVPRKTVSIIKIFNQIMDAVEYVHSKSIYHRDIKPENILISGIDWNIKLTDWGLATTSELSTDRNVGSERYMAPELFESNLDIQERKEPYNSSKVDIWAMGIVFLNIVFQKNPFSVANQTDKSFCYFAANREALFDVFSTMSYDFFQVLRYSLTIDPLNRNLTNMRNELQGLSEFTMDDGYYNSLGSDNFTPVSDSGEYMKYENGLSSSTTVIDSNKDKNDTILAKQIPFSLPNPVPSLTLTSSVNTQPILINTTNMNSPGTPNISSNSDNSHTHPESSFSSTTNTSRELSREKQKDKTTNESGEVGPRAKSVPKFKFNKRSHLKLEDPTIANNHNNYSHTYNKQTNRRKSFNDSGFRSYNLNNKSGNNQVHSNNNNKQPRGIKIQRRKKKPIIKNSRKPLGLPTPNSHMNSFFNDYKPKDNFNTSDFFTPPTLHNRYLEGIFNNQRPRHNSNKLQSHSKNNNYSNRSTGSYQNNNSNFTNNNNNNSSLVKNQKRPSTTGSAYGIDAINYSRSRGHSRNNSNTKLAVSPGRYIPPNLRITNLHPMDASSQKSISEVLDKPPVNTYHEQYSGSTSNLNTDMEPDLDDVLFTLEENDYDFVKDLNTLSMNDNIHSQPSNSQVPDLLKSNNNTNQSQDKPYTGSFSNGNFHGSLNSNTTIDNRRRSSTYKYKPGVYVPPHHRRLSIGSSHEETLSVSHNSITIGNGANPYYNQRRPSLTPSPRSIGINVPTSILHKCDRTLGNVTPSLENGFTHVSGRASPFPVFNHGTTTTAIQNKDVFAEDNDALVFEEDDELDENGMIDKRVMFGPYEIYDQNLAEPSSNQQKERMARKSSVLQDQAVDSLEEYRNNWLMLQQQE